jgi:bacteriocin leader peptide (microcyclamide/patellamide family)
MNNKSITPNPQRPVDRVPTGQLPSALAELSECTLDGAGATASELDFFTKLALDIAQKQGRRPFQF